MDDELTDVSGVSLAALLESGDSVLAAAVRRVLGDVDRQEQAISGWSSYLNEEPIRSE